MPAASRQPNWAVPPRRSGAQISPGHTFLKRECELFDGPFGCVAGTLFDQSRPAWPSDRLYARAPLEGGLRAEVSLEGLEALVGGGRWRASLQGREVRRVARFGRLRHATPL